MANAYTIYENEVSSGKIIGNLPLELVHSLYGEDKLTFDHFNSTVIVKRTGKICNGCGNHNSLCETPAADGSLTIDMQCMVCGRTVYQGTNEFTRYMEVS